MYIYKLGAACNLVDCDTKKRTNRSIHPPVGQSPLNTTRPGVSTFCRPGNVCMWGGQGASARRTRRPTQQKQGNIERGERSIGNHHVLARTQATVEILRANDMLPATQVGVIPATASAHVDSIQSMIRRVQQYKVKNKKTR